MARMEAVIASEAVSLTIVEVKWSLFKLLLAEAAACVNKWNVRQGVLGCV